MHYFVSSYAAVHTVNFSVVLCCMIFLYYKVFHCIRHMWPSTGKGPICSCGYKHRNWQISRNSCKNWSFQKQYLGRAWSHPQELFLKTPFLQKISWFLPISPFIYATTNWPFSRGGSHIVGRSGVQKDIHCFRVFRSWRSHQRLNKGT